MPGLSVACGGAVAPGGDSATSSDRRDALDASLDATECFEHYATATPLDAGNVVVSHTSYDGYPIRRLDTDHGTAFLEGRLYDVDDVDAHLERVAAMIADDDREGLREWVGARDGDFLVLVTDGEAATLLTDPFARLPAYLAAIDGTVLCSRELGFVREFARQREAPLTLDRLGVGQLLCFGYPLGTRTPFAGVRAVPPGSLVRLGEDADPDGVDRNGVDQHSGDSNAGVPGVRIGSVYDHDFDDCEHAERTAEANADELADRIATACRRRATPELPTVVSLSGGLDSRTVAGAYATSDEPAAAATFQRAGNPNDEEVATAGAVAKCLDLDWSVYAVESSPARRRTLLETKQGMNYLGMSFVLDFFEQLRERHGTATYVTGDGGDKVLVGLEPAKQPDSESALVKHAIEANSRMSVADAAAIANVDEAAIRASVAERIRSYPESDLARRYVHFLVRERGINSLIHGEDRNRYYAWSASPFYALSVFEYAMNCPDDQKAYRGLVARILERFDPALVDVSYPNYGVPITSNRYRAKQFVYDVLERYPDVRDRVVDLVTADDADRGPVTAAIREDLPRLDRAGLSASATAEVLAAPEQYSELQLEKLSTVSALASDVVRDAGDGWVDGTDPPAEPSSDDGAADVTTAGTPSPDDRITSEHGSARVER